MDLEQMMESLFAGQEQMTHIRCQGTTSNVWEDLACASDL
jgi:hypothetical protein